MKCVYVYIYTHPSAMNQPLRLCFCGDLVPPPRPPFTLAELTRWLNAVLSWNACSMVCIQGRLPFFFAIKHVDFFMRKRPSTGEPSMRAQRHAQVHSHPPMRRIYNESSHSERARAAFLRNGRIFPAKGFPRSRGRHHYARSLRLN